ncbi:MAG TPA: hypothetical protein VGL92_08055 [Acidimicrobiia bacterium]|jgi:hypothetical protein
MKLRLNKVGGQLGILFCLAGLVLIWTGWNGAASYNFLPRQFPYLISGGIAGLALVVIGVGLMVIQSARADRVQLEANLAELRKILDRMTGNPSGNGAEPSGTMVVAGPNAYHRPGCRLVEGREGLKSMTEDAARAAGLSPCRTCHAVGREVSLADEPQSTRGKRASS